MSPIDATNKPTVLVIDDSPESLSLVSSLLHGKYHVKVATSGPLGLQVARKHPAPDLILLDVVMPDMDGFEVCRQLKSDLTTDTIPVIFFDRPDRTPG